MQATDTIASSCTSQVGEIIPLDREQERGTANCSSRNKVLARTLFMVTRFWFDHLQETEGHIEFSVEDQRRGLEHHFAVLLPNLTAAARRKFEAALGRLIAGAGTKVVEGKANV